MPRIVCYATTPQELREEIVTLLLHRAKQQENLSKMTGMKSLRETHEYGAKVLGDLAGEIKCMELTHAGLTESAMVDNLGRYYDLRLWQEYLAVKARWEFAHQEYVSCPLAVRERARTVMMAERAQMDVLLAKLRATPEHLEAFGW